MADSAQINSMLLGRMQEVCMHLLPNGKVQGNHYMVGGLSGEAGNSLQITISGSAAGRFVDFANKDDKGGTPLYLWSKARNVSFRKACEEAMEWLGVKEEDFGIKRHKSKEWVKPSAADKSNMVPSESNTKVMDYLTIERKIDPIVIAKARIAESKDGECIYFPYYDAGEDEPFHIKKLWVDRIEGKKRIKATPGTRRGLYLKHMIDDNVREITLSEGEIDALSWHSIDVPAVSVPNGVNDFEWLEIDWDWLQRFERINVCMDMDEVGRAAAQDICKRLGLHRCYIVSLPKKDSNECITSGVTREEMLKCLELAKAIELDEIKKPLEFLSEVKALNKVDWNSLGFSTPWFPNIPWRLRKGEFTILTGFSGHGKTPALNQLMTHIISEGGKVMNASLEVKPAMTLFDMAICAMAKETATDAELEGCVTWLNDAIYFLDCIGTVSVDRLIHAMEYARKRHGIDVFVIDSLFKCGLSPDDHGAQRAFADKLTTFCNNTGAHVILVAHTRKMSSGNELSIPSKSDVAGSSDLVNAAFNVLIVWRNLLKNLKIDEARQQTPPDIETIDQWLDREDNIFVLEKQKFNKGKTAKVHMKFIPEANQFHTSKKKTPYFSLNG